ncbi:hypothetical protein CK203_062516 [Vitis vinifera]|uniref:Uncharacterized protein n=1 Tax=Vitis vinifera TaxID=29760 RepID=A0A438FWT7_VITVI|nr:hypothetical protein CK203_062516 [Vitis vinifera]
MSLRKRPSFAKSFRNSFDSSAKIFAAAKPSLAHECHFAEQEPPFRSCESAAKLQSVKIPVFAVKAPFRRVFRSCETKFGTRVPFRSTVTSLSKLRNGCVAAESFLLRNREERHSSRLFISLPSPTTRTSGHLLRSSLPAKFRQSDMARTRGAKSSSPSSRKRVPREAPVQGPTSEPPRPEAVSLRRSPPQNPPARRYLTRSGGRPLQKEPGLKAQAHRLNRAVPVPSPEPSPPSPAPLRSPASLRSTSRHFLNPKFHLVAPEVLIRRPMLTQPPIEGNLDCRARHFTLSCALTQPSNCGRSLQIHSAYCVDIIWSICWPQEISSTQSSHGFLSVHDYKQHWTQRRGVLLEALFKISEGYFFGPHHLIMAALLYFEEKVHKKKLQRADAIPLLFSTVLCQIWSIWGIHQILSWSANGGHSQLRYQLPGEHLHVIYLRVYPLPLLPYPEPLQLLQPHQSHLLQLSQGWPFPFQSKELCRSLQTLTASQSSLAQEMAAIRACQEQMLTTQAQHTAILRQLQHHLGLPSAAEHLTPTTAVPHSQATEPQAPPEAATEEAEPSA